MEKIETVSVALSDAVRKHEDDARAIYGASRKALASELGPNGAKTITNALDPWRRSARGRMARKDALLVVETVSWPDPLQVWRGASQLPTERELTALFRRSRELLKKIAPPISPTYVNPPSMPKGTGAALAGSAIPKHLKSTTVRHLQSLGVSKKLMAKIVASRLEFDLGTTLGISVAALFESGDNANPRLERLLRARAKRSPENVARKKRKDRERELRARRNKLRRAGRGLKQPE